MPDRHGSLSAKGTAGNASPAFHAGVTLLFDLRIPIGIARLRRAHSAVLCETAPAYKYRKDAVAAALACVPANRPAQMMPPTRGCAPRFVRDDVPVPPGPGRYVAVTEVSENAYRTPPPAAHPRHQ